MTANSFNRPGLVRALKLSERYDEKLLKAVNAFLVDTLGLRHPMAGFSNCERGIWVFWINENGVNAPYTPHASEPEGRTGEWLWCFAVSRRGSFATVESLSPEFSARAKTGYGYITEVPPRQLAVNWAQQVAVKHGLEYVDAKALRDWEVGSGDVDPEFFLDRGAVPTAFDVLFYE